MTELFALALLGGVLALDGTSVGQFMISRPIVAGLLTGWTVGHPAEGFLTGAILEVYLLVSFPVGGSRFPEGAPAAVVASALAASSEHPGGMALGIAVGLVWGQIGAYSATVLRTANARLFPDPATDTVTAVAVVKAHLTGVLLDFLRGAIVTAAGLLFGGAVLYLAPLWPLEEADTRGLLLVGGAVSLGVLLRSFGGVRRRGLLFASGLGMGALWSVLL